MDELLRLAMQKVEIFTLLDVQQALRQLNIPFVSSSTKGKSTYSFKSLRKIEPGGIYFLESDTTVSTMISNSIIIYSGVDFKDDSNVILKVDNPQLVFYQLMEHMLEKSARPQGIHPTAVVSGNCDIDPSAYIGPYCVLENCIVKARVMLHSHVTVMRGTTIEEDVTIESHSTVGATGVAWIWDPIKKRRVVQPQIGFTKIERGSFLGTDITVVRGSVNETTTIGEGCVIAHGSKIGHGSSIGAESHFANNISIAGNVTIGKQCFFGSGAVVRPQTRIAERTVVGAGAVIVKHIEKPGFVLAGNPAIPIKSASVKMTGVPKPLPI